MKTGLLSTIFALSALSMTAAKAELAHSYNFLDFGYERTSFEADGLEGLGTGNGFAADLNFSPVPSLLFAAEFHFSRPNERILDEGINTFDLKFGAGGYYPINDRISLYATVGPRYLKGETDALPSPSDWGIYVEPGIRINFTGNFEMYAAYEFSSNFDNINAGKVGALYQFSEALGIEVFGRFSAQWTYNYGIGLRISK